MRLTLDPNGRYHLGNLVNQARIRNFKGCSHIGKPLGLWYGFGDSWPSRCLTWHHHPDQGIYERWLDRKLFEVRLRPFARVLKINSRLDAENLQQSYPQDNYLKWVDWDKVFRDYDAVEFERYDPVDASQSSAMWYKLIDCVSGVARRRGIAKVREVPGWSKKSFLTSRGYDVSSGSKWDPTSTEPIIPIQTWTSERST